LVLTNLVSNAIKFTERGRIDVFVERATEMVRFTVQDTGPGIAREERARIFEPFEQVVRVEWKHLQGFGLGLALVKEMVTALKGQVELRSEVGVGSTFVVSFPALPTADAPRTSSA
jgi:two-component system, sensor histidine kinase